jgi:hypothetical protein
MSQPEKDPAMWSRRFAREIVSCLDVVWEGKCANEAESVVNDLTEAFRYLPPGQVNATERFAKFLRTSAAEVSREPLSSDWAVRALREIVDFAMFLRSRHGYPRPADENDEWSDEDRRDFALAAWRRLDEEDAKWENKDASAR